MSSLPLVNKAFERGPFETGGGASTVNNTWWMASSEGYIVEGAIPSERMIVDLSNLASALLIHPAGQSGHPYHENYIDMAEMWANIEYNLLGWKYDQVSSDASHTLTLVP